MAEEKETGEQQGSENGQDSEKARDTDDGVEVNPVEMAEVQKSEDAKADGKARDVNLKMILDVPVDIHIQLGHTKISIGEVLNMGAGSIVELDREAGAPADMIINGKLIGQGEVVVVDNNFGIRVTKLISPEERIESF